MNKYIIYISLLTLNIFNSPIENNELRVDSKEIINSNAIKCDCCGNYHIENKSIINKTYEKACEYKNKTVDMVNKNGEKISGYSKKVLAKVIIISRDLIKNSASITKEYVVSTGNYLIEKKSYVFNKINEIIKWAEENEK